MKISKATKILWSIVLGYIIITILLGITIQGVIPELMALKFGDLLFGALILQLIIFITNKFLSGLNSEDIQ